MNKILMTLTLAATLATGAIAAGNDPSEKGVPRSPLKIHSFGGGLAALTAVNDELQDASGKTLVGLSLNHSWQFQEDVALFADINWFFGDETRNFGLDVGIDYFVSTSNVRPFIGAGIGGHYFYRKYNEDGDAAGFSDKFGPSITAHLGVAIDVNETTTIRLRAPYRAVLNETVDQVFGIDVSVMFSSKFKKIKKLDY